MADDDPIVQLIAMQLTATATLSALLKVLTTRGLFLAGDTRETYEQALLVVEESRGSASPLMTRAIDLARQVIEEKIRP